MDHKQIHLTPFTNVSGMFNLSLSTPVDDSRMGDQSFSPYDNPADVVSISNTSSFMGPHTVSCHVWQDAQHTLFQMANLCAAVSLLTPSSFRHHLLFLRCLLLVAYLLFVLWAGLFICMMDVLVWNCVFFIVDIVHIVCLAYTTIPRRFSPCLNELYSKKLKPLKVCRRDFAEFCNLGNVIPLRKGSRYSVENQTPCGEKVSILLHGRLKVTHDGMFLHSIEANEFVDSPEFDSVPYQTPDNTEKYQVTITAAEESLIISWLYPSLKSYLASNMFLSTVIQYMVGKDISDKLYRIQEFLQRDQGEIESSFMSRHTPVSNVRKCLLPSDVHRLNFANASKILSESPLRPGILQETNGTFETSV